MEKRDIVNHPAHYETGKFECIDVMVEIFGAEKVAAFCECNAFKYLYRCEHKHETPEDDWKKARWYLNKALQLTGAEMITETGPFVCTGEAKPLPEAKPYTFMAERITGRREKSGD